VSIIGSKTFNPFAITFIKSVSLVILLVTRPGTVLFTKSDSILESLFAYYRYSLVISLISKVKDTKRRIRIREYK